MDFIRVIDSRQLQEGGTFDKPLSLTDIYNAMDRSKVDWISLSHSNSSMIKKGRFPVGHSRADVEKLVRGTFGGSFKSFNENEGTFEYMAYTD